MAKAYEYRAKREQTRSLDAQGAQHRRDRDLFAQSKAGFPGRDEVSWREIERGIRADAFRMDKLIRRSRRKPTLKRARQG